LRSTLVEDLSPLTQSQIADLNLTACAKLKDLSPLLQIPTLERITLLAQQIPLMPPLRAHPRLAIIAIAASRDEPVGEPKPVADFWKEYDSARNGGH
jgi:hypothetical protein